MNIDLQAFCYTGDSIYRQGIIRPWRLGDKAYATDGVVLLEVEPEDISPNLHAPNKSLPRVIGEWQSGEWKPLPTIEEPKEPATQVCSSCYGDAEIDCEDCHGLRTEPKTIEIQIGNRTFNQKYLKLISTLPGLLVNESGDLPTPMSFKFDGGRGLLMPMKPQQPVNSRPVPKPRRKRKAKVT
jgi:hypothetical protein